MSDAAGVFDKGEIALMREAYRRAAADLPKSSAIAISQTRDFDDQLAIHILREVARGHMDITTVANRAVEALMSHCVTTTDVAQSLIQDLASRSQIDMRSAAHTN